MPRPLSPVFHSFGTARQTLRNWLTLETTSGALLLVAAALALLFANSPWREAYEQLSSLRVGPEHWHLDLSLASWASDGLLAVFFFLVGVELKHEVVAGGLRDFRQAAVPVFAAVGGMITPAIVFSVTVVSLGEPSALHGWAIPTATDIAFAVGVLAIFGRGLPRALRLFLLTLAVIDDLLAIIVIAIFYTNGLSWPNLALALAFVAAYAILVRQRRAGWWVLFPLGVLAWGFMHASGVHATIAGVLVGLTVPAHAIAGEQQPRTLRYGDVVRPFTNGVALPIFAFFAAGVDLVDGADGDGVLGIVAQPVVLGIVLGLVVGKVVGVLGTTWLLTRFTPLRLPDAIGIRDLLPVGYLTGIGFTVALLVSELSFPDSEHTAGAKFAILTGTLISATLAAATLRWDARRQRLRDMNRDGEPDRHTKLIENPGDLSER